MFTGIHMLLCFMQIHIFLTDSEMVIVKWTQFFQHCLFLQLNSSICLGSGTPVKSKVDKVQKEKPNIDEYLLDARFFIMKSSNHENVSLSKAKVSLLKLLNIFHLQWWWLSL